MLFNTPIPSSWLVSRTERVTRAVTAPWNHLAPWSSCPLGSLSPSPQESHEARMDSEFAYRSDLLWGLWISIKASTSPSSTFKEVRERRPPWADEPSPRLVRGVVRGRCLCERWKKASFSPGQQWLSVRQSKGWTLTPLNPLAQCPCAMNNRHNYTWWFAKHYLSLSIATSYY